LQVLNILKVLETFLATLFLQQNYKKCFRQKQRNYYFCGKKMRKYFVEKSAKLNFFRDEIAKLKFSRVETTKLNLSEYAKFEKPRNIVVANISHFAVSDFLAKLFSFYCIIARILN
jgi:hypothetical protein